MRFLKTKMKITSYYASLKIIILLLFCLFSTIDITYAEITRKTLLCGGWLKNEAGGDVSSDDATETSDNKGVKGQCRDYFPTWGEREMIYRVNADPFANQYKVKRQYCWARFVLGKGTYCGGPHLKFHWKAFIPIPYYDWDPPAYISWGDTKTVTFNMDEVGADASALNNSCKSLVGSLNKACVVRIEPGKERPEGGTNDGNQAQICGYFKSIFGFIVGHVDVNKSLIGCIDEPYLHLKFLMKFFYLKKYLWLTQKKA